MELNSNHKLGNETNRRRRYEVMRENDLSQQLATAAIFELT